MTKPDIQKAMTKINDNARYNSTASLNALLDEVIDSFGGVKQVAEAMHAAYVTSKPGSSGQVRIIDGVIRMLMRRDSDETAYEEMDGYTEKQLKAMLAQELNVDEQELPETRTGPNTEDSPPAS